MSSTASDFVVRFLFEELDIRGAFVRLGDAWRDMQARRGYAPAVRDDICNHEYRFDAADLEDLFPSPAQAQRTVH